MLYFEEKRGCGAANTHNPTPELTAMARSILKGESQTITKLAKGSVQAKNCNGFKRHTQFCIIFVKKKSN